MTSILSIVSLLIVLTIASSTVEASAFSKLATDLKSVPTHVELFRQHVLPQLTTASEVKQVKALSIETTQGTLNLPAHTSSFVADLIGTLSKTPLLPSQVLSRSIAPAVAKHASHQFNTLSTSPVLPSQVAKQGLSTASTTDAVKSFESTSSTTEAPRAYPELKVNTALLGWIIAIIIIGCVLVFCCGGGGYYYHRRSVVVI